MFQRPSLGCARRTGRRRRGAWAIHAGGDHHFLDAQRASVLLDRCAPPQNRQVQKLMRAELMVSSQVCSSSSAHVQMTKRAWACSAGHFTSAATSRGARRAVLGGRRHHHRSTDAVRLGALSPARHETVQQAGTGAGRRATQQSDVFQRAWRDIEHARSHHLRRARARSFTHARLTMRPRCVIRRAARRTGRTTRCSASSARARSCRAHAGHLAGKMPACASAACAPRSLIARLMPIHTLI